MTESTERTNLLPNESVPKYVFNSNYSRDRQRRVKQFQCCICVIFLSIFALAIVITISYSINSFSNLSDQNVTENNDTIPIDNLIVLFSKSWPIDDKKILEKTCNESDCENALLAGQKALETRRDIEKNITVPPISSPTYRHQKTFTSSDKARLLSSIGYQEEFATRNILANGTKHCYNSTFEICARKQISCNVFTKYRSYNGTCNNLQYPTLYGVAYQKFRRALPPAYADGISKPRIAKDGGPLPSARTVSLVVHPSYRRNNDKFTVVLAVWGQFLDHDITATALSQSLDGNPISCCPESKHPECFPVKLDKTDSLSIYNNVTCMDFVRSAPAPTCCLGPREQMNQVTAFIDGSVIYNVDEDHVTALRRFQKGQLDMYLTEDNRTLLPVSKDLKDGCNRLQENQKGRYCFLAGDARSNENLHLTSMHLIWARHHNLLTEKLSNINPHWSDEKLFQEARRIIGAQMQHITYNEFLPILLGDEIMEKYELFPKKGGYFMNYNASVDPSIANNFATAAFRFAHSIIPGLMKFLANDTSSPEYIQLHRMLFDPYKLYQPGEFDRVLKGAMDTTIQASDPYFTTELKDHLFEDNFENKNKICGLDLVSLNIQRGRDHGLVGYNSWREYCGLRRVHTFQQLYQDLDDDSLRNIQTVFRDVDDIDLYTGALSEKPLEGSILGPTITCLILDQFIRIKVGDRFWYENPYIFTLEQLDEIRKTTLGQIICDNSDDVDQVQFRVMEKFDSSNPMISCKNQTQINWKFWKEHIKKVAVSNPEILVKYKN